MPDEFVYVYGVTATEPTGLDSLAGVRGASVRVIEKAGLHAIVSPVPSSEFGQEHIEDRMQDLDWLAATARAHHAVIDAVARGAAVAPLALATVFAGDDRVRAALAERRAEFADVLDRITGRVEWGLKAYARDRPASEPQERPTSGAEYLRRRRAAAGATEAHTEQAFRAAEALHDAVAGASVAARLHRVHDSTLTGHAAPMVLNASYLVDSAGTALWTTVVEAAAPAALDVEITGPWAPYSFAGTGTGGDET